MVMKLHDDSNLFRGEFMLEDSLYYSESIWVSLIKIYILLQVLLFQVNLLNAPST